MAPPINMDENLVRESLECAICKDYFDEPKQLVCGHTFCLNCIERLDKIPQACRPNDFSDDLAYPYIRFAVQCPQCRDFCVIPQSGLNTNYVVKEMVEKFRDIGVSHHPAIMSSENSNSKITCETCKRHSILEEVFMCNTCTKRQKENKKEIFLCSLCIVTRGHKDHEIIICTELATKTDRVGAVNKVMAFGEKARNHVQKMKEISTNVFMHLNQLPEKVDSRLSYFNTLRTHCTDSGTSLTKQDLGSKVMEAEALELHIEQTQSKLEKVRSDNIRSICAIITEFERFNPLPKQQNLIDFDPIPTTSSAAEVALFSPPTSNIFAYNDGEMDNKRRRAAMPKRKPTQRRIGNNEDTNENASTSPIVLD